MLTFSVNEVDAVQMLRVQKTIQDNIQYFKKFNGANWQEAVNKTFMVAVQHVKSEYDVLDPYIKNLARNILKEQEKESPVDTVTEDGEVSYPFLKLTTSILLSIKKLNFSIKVLNFIFSAEITSQATKLNFLLAHSFESKSRMLPAAKLRGFL